MMATGNRVLGIDAGERRVGLALSDDTRLLARPLRVLQRRSDLVALIESMRAIIEAEGVVALVVGLPLNEDGTEGRQARRSRFFADRLAAQLTLPVTLWDERHSTRDAEAAIREQGRSTRKARHHGEVDAVAAAVILQDYLDARTREAARAVRLQALDAARATPA